MSTLPTRLYGGVTVPNTPLITSALAFSKAHSTPTLHNHMIRSWLLGFLIADKVPHLQSRDREAHSIAALLHDVGLDPTHGLISEDKCFEVDSANAALAFLSQQEEKEQAGAVAWDRYRKQLVWDAIALHASIHIALHKKEPEVVATAMGIGADLMGPEEPMFKDLLPREEYETVVAAVPRLGIKTEFAEAMCELCRRKPQACVGSVAERWGERYVEGFKPRTVLERLEGGIERLG
ncbi:MAG: hypothetical protein LQ339_009039 [Xanthoria mediterranea]|nr:MAG: hypothetical protein LQ339_009039 [Xanthoria mediterranea]